MCLLSRKATGSSAPAQSLVAKQNLLLQQITLSTPLPETLDFRLEAALEILYFMSCRALLHSAHARAGESVLVHWASRGAGLATCQIARAHGLKVLGTAGSEEGKKLILQNRAHEGFNHKEANYIDKIKTSVGDKDKGVDVIIEILANENLSFCPTEDGPLLLPVEVPLR